MKKIPTVFVREFENHRVKAVTPEFTSPETRYAFEHGTATIKVDGSCCALIGGEPYKRYDAKKGKTPPPGAIPCCEPDPVTGHWPHWVKLDRNNPSDKWFIKAFEAVGDDYDRMLDATFEAVGPHFNGNPHGYIEDVIIQHGIFICDDFTNRTFEGVREYLERNKIEGIVFWVGTQPVCKIKRTDFGLEWPGKKGH